MMRSYRRCMMLMLVALGTVPLLSGCSVGMALSGQKEPNLAVCRIGANRSDMEVQLGAADRREKPGGRWPSL